MYDMLFSPMSIGNVEIKNRIVMTAAEFSLGEPSGKVTPRLSDYYEERAKGGVGLIIPGICRVNDMTGATADRYRLENRGYLKEGYKADITILDVDKLKVNEAIPDFTPGGIEYVYINGSPIVEEGKYLSVKAGELILRKGYKEAEEETKQSPASKRKILRKVVRV